MSVHRYFPTSIYTAALQRSRSRDLDLRLLLEIQQLCDDDAAGRRWSARNYPGGYTSYGSSHRLQRISPTFAELESKLKRHVAAFSRTLQWNLHGRELAMTDCWANIMSKQAAHALHLHPVSTLSGTYYVSVPAGASGIKFEDPRLDRFMAAPPRKVNARPENRAWITVTAKPGHLVLFESWLRHEVPPNRTSTPRVSISFNYNWF